MALEVETGVLFAIDLNTLRLRNLIFTTCVQRGGISKILLENVIWCHGTYLVDK